MILRTSLALVLVLASPLASADDPGQPGPVPVASGRESSGAEQHIEPGAEAAVATLERFSAALSAGDLDGVAASLDPAVLIFESGGAERSRDEIQASKDGKMLTIMSTETAVLRKTAQNWKIVHLHWSSRVKP